MVLLLVSVNCLMIVMFVAIDLAFYWCLWCFEQKEGTYTGKKFNAICHFFGYQARGSLPSKFDCDYAYVC